METIRGAKCSSIITDDPVASIMSISREMIAASGSKENHLPVADIGINWLIFNKNSDTDSMKRRAVKIAEILDFFIIKCGYVVNPICDLEARFHSKMESILRRSKIVTQDALTRASRFKLNHPNQRLASIDRSRLLPLLWSQQKKNMQRFQRTH